MGYEVRVEINDAGNAILFYDRSGNQVASLGTGGATAAITSLTNNTGSTANNTLEDCNDAVTGVDGTGSNAASKTDVDTRLVSISNNISDLGSKVNEILVAIRAAGSVRLS